MKERLNRCLQTFIILLLLIPLYIFPIVKADSNVEANYTNTNTNTYNEYYMDNDENNGNFFTSIYFFCFVFVIIILLIFSPKEMAKKQENYNKYIKYEFMDITPERLEEILPGESIDFLKQELFLHFIELQNARMNFDYNELRQLCTDELYNTYVSKLEMLELKHCQNIMHNFNFIDAKIKNIEIVNNEIVLTVFMCVDFYDYTINTKTNKITKGNNGSKVLNNYIMTFVKEKENKKKKKRTCPNCGAPNKNISSGECQYCHSTLITKASRFVLNSKKNINKY